MTTPALAPDVISRAAADTLRRLGWTQGHYIGERKGIKRSRRPVCLVEAIGRAVGLPPAALAQERWPRSFGRGAKWDAAQNLMDEMSQQLGRDPERDLMTPRQMLTNWNDDETRTLDEVLAALEPSQVRT